MEYNHLMADANTAFGGGQYHIALENAKKAMSIEPKKTDSYYFKRDFDATATIEDADPSSGLDKVIFKLIPYSNGQMQEEEYYPVEIKNNQATYTVRAGFKGQIYSTAYDKVKAIPHKARLSRPL